LGYAVESASDGSEAIDIYRKALESGDGFDIVILDLTIPGGMGGKEAMAALLKINPAVRVIVSSGYSTDPVMSEYKKYGFKAFIEKPYTMAKLSEVVNNVCEGK
jgi:two-component system cell cycle sensor histidine kinase/response regulator CckA